MIDPDELRMELELEAIEAAQAAAQRSRSPQRRPLTEAEQEESWRQDDLMANMADFMREDY